MRWLACVLLVGCGGSDDKGSPTDSTPSTTDTDTTFFVTATTGTGTGTGTTEPTPPGDAFVRPVHLLSLFDDPLVLADDSGTSYAELAPASAHPTVTVPAVAGTLEFLHDGAPLLSLTRTWVEDARVTVLVHGTQLGPLHILVPDDDTTIATGQHRITFFHLNPVRDVPYGLEVGDLEPAGITPGASSTFEVPAGELMVRVDVDNDRVADLGYRLQVPADAWSLAYLYPWDGDGNGYPGSLQILHHASDDDAALVAVPPEDR